MFYAFLNAALGAQFLTLTDENICCRCVPHFTADRLESYKKVLKIDHERMSFTETRLKRIKRDINSILKHNLFNMNVKDQKASR